MTSVGIVTGAGRGMGAACTTRLVEMVDFVLLVDRDETSILESVKTLSGEHRRADIEPLCLDITDRDGLQRLAARVSELGMLRAVAHAAGVSPTMADWRRVVTVDLVGTAMLADALFPIASTDTAIVCFASMAPLLAAVEVDPAVDAALDDPLDARLLDRLHAALETAIEDSGMAYFFSSRSRHPIFDCDWSSDVCSSD